MVAAPDLSGREAEYVNECLRTNWISSRGRFISEFEARFAAFTQRKHAIATCNGTVALHLALLGLGLQPGDEVIVPSLTYVATANAVTYCGATPVFADSDPTTWCVSVESMERLITPRTRGLIPVHLYGHPCDMEPILALAQERGLWVLEDCAEAQGATYDGRPVGSFGAAAMFSFFGNKVVTTGEGGMVLADDDVLAARLRLLRGQGMDLQRSYWHPIIGHNFRMTNIEAAIGLGQMEHVEQLIRDRRRIAGWYRERLCDVASLTLPGEAPRVANVFWLYSILVEKPGRRDPLMKELAEDGIETRPFFYPAHTFPMYRDCRSDKGCPVAQDLATRGINLPTSSYLKEKDVDFIAATLRNRLVHTLPWRLPQGPARERRAV
jgi:perosamine synthetase